MIGTAISAGIGLASGIIGASKAAKAREQQRLAIGKQEAQNNAWYERNYYQNYLDSTEAQAALKRVEDTMRRNNAASRAAATVNGSTPEAAMAAQQQNNEALANVTENLAARADQRRYQVDAMNQANQKDILNRNMQQQQLDEAGGSQLMNNGMGLVGQAVGQMGGINGLFKKNPEEEV